MKDLVVWLTNLQSAWNQYCQQEYGRILPPMHYLQVYINLNEAFNRVKDLPKWHPDRKAGVRAALMDQGQAPALRALAETQNSACSSVLTTRRAAGAGN